MRRSWIDRFLSSFIEHPEDVHDVRVRAAYGSIEAWVSIVVNAALFIIKLVLGIFSHSMSLIADAVHSFSDLLSSIAILIGVKAAQKPSDKEHPFGHGRMELVTTLIVSGFIFLAGYELFKDSFMRILHPQPLHVNGLILILVTGTIVLNELLARFSYALAKRIDSSLLKADGDHHRSDALSSILVLVALVLAFFGFAWLDGYFGVCVSLMILKMAYSCAKDSVSALIGEAPRPEDLEKIESLAQSCKGVLHVHDIICHRYGTTQLISLHVEISDKSSVAQAHDIADAVEKTIKEQMKANVVVHIDPVNQDHPRYEELRDALTQAVQKQQAIASFYELRVKDTKGELSQILFTIAFEMGFTDKEHEEVKKTLSRQLHAQYPSAEVLIKIAPPYAYTQLK